MAEGRLCSPGHFLNKKGKCSSVGSDRPIVSMSSMVDIWQWLRVELGEEVTLPAGLAHRGNHERRTRSLPWSKLDVLTGQLFSLGF